MLRGLANHRDKATAGCSGRGHDTKSFQDSVVFAVMEKGLSALRITVGSKRAGLLVQFVFVPRGWLCKGEGFWECRGELSEQGGIAGVPSNP